MTDRYQPLRDAANALTPEEYAAKLAEHLEEKCERLAQRGIAVIDGELVQYQPS